jgi:predicted outer membrane repeat protein
LRDVVAISGLFLLLPFAAAAETLIVNPDGTGDYPTIQAAINAASNGDIIELTDGTFGGSGNRDIDYAGKSITVRSQGGSAQACVIDCGGSEGDPHRGFRFISGEGPASVLEGVTITNGFSIDVGGAIVCESSSPTISNCDFTDNSAAGGGAVAYDGCPGSPLLTDCRFAGNSSLGFGGAIDCFETFLEVESCVLSGNTANDAGGALELSYSPARFRSCAFSDNAASWGGGVDCFFSPATFVYCTFSGNAASAYDGGAVYGSEGSAIELTNATLSANGAALQGGAIYLEPGATAAFSGAIVAFGTSGGAVHASEGAAILSCCDLFGNAGGDWVGGIADQEGTAGNFSEDPLFCDAAEDYRLDPGSPCLPGNHPYGHDCGLIGAHGIGCGLVGAPTGVSGPGNALALAVRPNPCRGVARVSYVGAPVRRARLFIHDVTGRLIRAIDLPGATGVAVWDGKDAAGDPVAPGVYFIRLPGVNAIETRRIVVIR